MLDDALAAAVLLSFVAPVAGAADLDTHPNC